MTRKKAKNFLIYALPLLFILILAGSYFHIFDHNELQALDLRFKLRPAMSVTDKVAIIEIGDDTIKSFGRWPLDRNYHALMVKALSDAGAKAIVFDIFFSEKREYDDELENAIKDAGNVYLPFVFDMTAGREGRPPLVSGYVAKNLEWVEKWGKGEGAINIIPAIYG